MLLGKFPGMSVIYGIVTHFWFLYKESEKQKARYG
jgi:hypothetical protein